jgi:hypothetical protein
MFHCSLPQVSVLMSHIAASSIRTHNRYAQLMAKAMRKHSEPRRNMQRKEHNRIAMILLLYHNLFSSNPQSVVSHPAHKAIAVKANPPATSFAHSKNRYESITHDGCQSNNAGAYVEVQQQWQRNYRTG